MYFQTQAEFLTTTSCYDSTLFTLSIIKKLRRRCQVDIAAKGGCVSRVGVSVSEGNTSTTGESENMSYFRCHENVAE
jgi:hypothetical protein